MAATLQRGSGIIGRQLTIGGQPRTVVGIMPDTFEFPSSPELWMPLEEATLGGGESEIGTAVRVFGVLRAGVTFEQATTEVNALSQQIPSTTIRVDEMRIRFRPFAAEVDAANLAASALVGVLVMVLLVVASNVATLVFARTWSRAPELAVRTALGAAAHPRRRSAVPGDAAARLNRCGHRDGRCVRLASLDQGFARRLAVLHHPQSESAHRRCSSSC